MSLISAIPIIGNVVDKVFGVIDKAVADKDLKEKLKQEVHMAAMTIDFQEIDSLIKERSNVIRAEIEAGGANAKWRPHLMYLFMAILANNFILAQWGNKVINLYMYSTGRVLPESLQTVPVLEMPTEGWILLIGGTCGYVLGRSGEKIMAKLMESRIAARFGGK